MKSLQIITSLTITFLVLLSGYVFFAIKQALVAKSPLDESFEKNKWIT